MYGGGEGGILGVYRGVWRGEEEPRWIQFTPGATTPHEVHWGADRYGAALSARIGQTGNSVVAREMKKE